jgi:hypothetical protein
MRTGEPFDSPNFNVVFLPGILFNMILQVLVLLTDLATKALTTPIGGAVPEALPKCPSNAVNNPNCETLYYASLGDSW